MAEQLSFEIIANNQIQLGELSESLINTAIDFPENASSEHQAEIRTAYVHTCALKASLSRLKIFY